MSKLQNLIDMLSKARKIHISVWDLNGILNTPSTKISFENVVHSKQFCEIAKSTDNGYKRCLKCRRIANKKATTTKQAFYGYCMYGIYEAAMPVIIGDNVSAIVYVGNAIIDKKQTENRIEKICRNTNVDKQKLLELTKECEYIDNYNELLNIAEIVCDYIKMLYDLEPKNNSKTNWLVSSLKQHANQTFYTNTTLKELSILYHKNEKYLGRLFKNETGTTFHQYNLALRLQKAEKLLKTTSDKVIDIALDCGFNNISYFNRAFKKQFGMTPSEYVLSKNK